MTSTQHHRITAAPSGGSGKGRAISHYRIDGPCQACGCPTTDRVCGTRQQAQDLIAHRLIRCRRCLAEGR